MNGARAKILLLVTGLGSGGAERVVYDLARGVNAARADGLVKYTAEVAALDGRGAYAAALRDAGIPVHDLGMYRKYAPRAFFRLRRLLREGGWSLLHTHLFHANLLGRLTAARTGIPVLSTCHIQEKRHRPWHFWLDRWTAGAARAEVCVSAATAEFQQARTGLPAGFFRIIPNGIDLARFTPPDAEKRAILRNRWLPAARARKDTVICGFLGRFDRQKGGDTLLAAWKLLPENARAGAILLFGGYGREEKNWKRLAAGAEDIVFCGAQAEPQEFLGALDLSVMPSRYEGFGLAAVEAMACGAAVAASTAVTGIITDGADGVQFPPENPVLLADALTQLILNPRWRQTLADAGRRRAGVFSAEKMTAAYLKLYDEIAVTPH